MKADALAAGPACAVEVWPRLGARTDNSKARNIRTTTILRGLGGRSTNFPSLHSTETGRACTLLAGAVSARRPTTRSPYQRPGGDQALIRIASSTILHS